MPWKKVKFWPACSYHDQDSGFYYLKSRYYDPQICRFINADNYASTGQGFSGCNMFVYCNDSPVAFEDSGGRRMVSCVDDWNVGGGRSETPSYEPINGQHLPEYCDIPYGNSTIGYSGCEVIALYNMLILRNAGESISSIIDFMVDRFNKTPCLLSGWGMHGKFGAAPQDIASFLSSREINYQFSYSMSALNKNGEPGIFIVSFWNSTPVISGYHTVAVSYDGTDYVAYNYNCDRDMLYSSTNGLKSVLNGNGGFFFGFFIPNS